MHSLGSEILPLAWELSAVLHMRDCHSVEYHWLNMPHLVTLKFLKVTVALDFH